MVFNRLRARLTMCAAAVLLGLQLALLVVADVEAQGPFSAQIQRALAAFAAAPVFTGAATGTSLTLAQGTLTADAQALSTTATWSNAGVTFTHWKSNITDTNSAAASLLIDLQVAGVSQFKVTKGGDQTNLGGVVSGKSVQAGGGFAFLWASRSTMASPSDGVILLQNNAGTDFSRLLLGCATTSCGGIARSGAGFKFVLADNSANTFVTASIYNSTAVSALTVSSNTITPTSTIHQVGAGLIKTITVPASCTPTCTIFIEPTAAYTYDATGNIIVPGGGGTAVIGRLMTFVWQGTKWVPSY